MNYATTVLYIHNFEVLKFSYVNLFIMSLSRLQLEKVRPSTSTSRTNTPRSVKIKTQGRNTPRAETFKNPLLGIQVNLIQKLQEVDQQYHETSYKKRHVLLDAIEDIANSKTGFRKQILQALEVWRPPKSEQAQGEMFETRTLVDLVRTQKQFRSVATDHEKANDTIRHLKQEIQIKELETEKYKLEIDRLKQKVLTQSDHFASARRLNHSFNELLSYFDNIFVPPPPQQENYDIEQLLQENKRMKKLRERMLYELNICQQITKRMKIMDEDSSDDE